ncbi:cytochrome P450 [Venturia nashicola]|nr:cytochrome P450 [Venturia nashicola]
MLSLENIQHGLGDPTVQWTLAVVLPFTLYRLYLTLWRPAFLPKAPQLVEEGVPIVGSTGFWSARWDFCKEWSLKKGHFGFYVGKNRVIAVTGAAARQDFFNTRNEVAPADNGHEFSKHFTSRLTRMLKGGEFLRNLPKLVRDLKNRLDKLADEPDKITNPFDSIYEIVFQLTMRTVGCNEIADDPKLLSRAMQYNRTIELSSTPTRIIFPWIPTPAMFRQLYAGAGFYAMFDKVIKQRKKENRRDDDALQICMDQGDSTKDVIGVVFGSLFAGQLNSGINAAWILIYLAKYPYWKQKVLEQVIEVASKNCKDPTAPLVDQLISLPIDVWEGGFPLLDLCLRDSIRLQTVGTAFRKNLSGHDVKIGNATIPNGYYVVYAMGDIHNDESIYPDPARWDPGRYLPDRAEDKKVPYAWAGWGLGRHPCLGMRFAKLENVLITAFWVAMFEFELVDRDGKPTEELPQVDINGFTANKPANTKYLRYWRRGESKATF